MNKLLCWLLLCTAMVARAQTYDPPSRVLTLPNVNVAGVVYTDVLLRLNAVELVSVGAPPVTSVSYDITSRILTLPAVLIEGTSYLHVTLRLNDVEVVSVGAPPSRIYVNLVAHNEDTATGNNPDCLAFFSGADQQYNANSAALEAIVQTVRDRKATFNFQSDVEYLNLVLAREGAQDNVLRRLATNNSGTLEVDAHAHESVQKNYADVANLVERVAGVRNGIVGGFTAVTCRPDAAAPVWDKFRSPLAPASGSGASFNATVLTLGASAGHVCDPDAAGIWRPASTSDFFTDDPAQSLITIGTGYAAKGLTEAAAAVARLAGDLKAGKLEPNRMYTASVTLAHCNMHLSGSGATAADVATFIDAVNALDDATDFIRWATFSQMADIWKTSYQKKPSVWRGP